MKKLRLLDLFSGIGGFSLGLERSGYFETVAFCEIEPFCRKILAKHWPQVQQYNDIRQLTASQLAADGIAVDAIAGGFPCQDLSTAGRGAGLSGEKSGLWREYARLIGELRPRFVIVENVSALLARGFGQVLSDLASLGYDAEWEGIPASAIGSPHRRDRLWIIAYPNGSQCEGRGLSGGILQEHSDVGRCGWWEAQPGMDRVAYGVPSQVDRLRAIGNAVVPQIPELIGRAIGASLHD
jgi:DNA (cytosine-5)-methyltransferase 1